MALAAADERVLFERALGELASGAGPRYQQLRAQLDDYPLALYLDYETLSAQLHTVTPQDAKAFLARADGSPLHNRFLAAYLEHKGRDRHWREFLAVQDSPPRDARLQCFYYRARRDTGDKAEAWRGAALLWNVGRSQDAACDPLFERWLAHGGGPDDALVWSRALKAFDSRNPHLIRYVKRYASAALGPMLDELASVYRRPDKLVNDAHEPDLIHAQLMTVGIRRLARINPEQARQALLNALPIQPFTDLEREAMETMIVRHSLFAKASAPEPWLVDQLERLADDELTEIYLRNQVADGNWRALLVALDWLSPGAQAKDQWRYWQARALESSGDAEAAEALYADLAGERSYHGFLAADKLGLAYALNSAPVPAAKTPDDAGVARVSELMAIDRIVDAKQEWRQLLWRLDRERGLAAAHWAMASGWSDLAIDAANHFKAWDQVALRFPDAHGGEFARAAANVNLDEAELKAIARRESGLYPYAQSSVGARGLMQLMPATARRMARQLGLPYRREKLFQADYNVTLGSHYYQSLLTRFNGHRPKALAGYNAGPNRVERWADRDIPIDRWIDSLPFKETREYVQAVLAYTVIYRAREGAPVKVLTRDEWSLSHQRKNL